ncbi:MAG: hypothetical protein R2699_17820 [Acidimicrobiales bacterium]
MLEWITPVGVPSCCEPWSPELRGAGRGRRAAAARWRWSSRELDRLASADVAAVRHALGALGWGAWNDLREAGVSVDDATAAVRLTVQRLLDLPNA